MKGLVVTGCLVQRYAEEMRAELPEIDAICGTGSYESIVDAANAALGGHKAAYLADMASAALEGGRDRLTPPYTAYFKIAEGCSNRCGYCIIPKLRGPYRSRGMDALLAEAQALADAGVKELIVIAQDITKYGMDLPGHQRLLPELLRRLCEMDFHWVRLHYACPDRITDGLVEVICRPSQGRQVPGHPTLQHVSKYILRAFPPGDGEEFALAAPKACATASRRAICAPAGYRPAGGGPRTNLPRCVRFCRTYRSGAWACSSFSPGESTEDRQNYPTRSTLRSRPTAA